MDAALQALGLPLREGRVPLPTAGRSAAFIGARAPLPAGLQPLCIQADRLLHDALRIAGADVLADSAPLADGSQALVMVLPSRAKMLARAQLAEAARLCALDGMVVASASNDEGAKSLETDMRRLFGAVSSLSKHKCRVAWAPAATVDHALRWEWSAAALPRQRGDGLWTRAGVFSADAIDPASALLLEHLPSTLRGQVADLGAGIGVLARAVADRCAAVTGIAAYEADARALAMAERNLAGARPAVTLHWHDVTRGIEGRFDAIVMNPPFHATGKRGMPELGQRFIEVAAAALAPAGELWMVANTHLPYEDALAQRFAVVEPVATRAGFKVLRAMQPRT